MYRPPENTTFGQSLLKPNTTFGQSHLNPSTLLQHEPIAQLQSTVSQISNTTFGQSYLSPSTLLPHDPIVAVPQVSMHKQVRWNVQCRKKYESVEQTI